MRNGFSLGAQRANPENKRDKANDEQNPGDKLVPGKWIKKPNIDIENEKSSDEFPCKETVEAM